MPLCRLARSPSPAAPASAPGSIPGCCGPGQTRGQPTGHLVAAPHLVGYRCSVAESRWLSGTARKRAGSQGRSSARGAAERSRDERPLIPQPVAWQLSSRRAGQSSQSHSGTTSTNFSKAAPRRGADGDCCSSFEASCRRRPQRLAAWLEKGDIRLLIDRSLCPRAATGRRCGALLDRGAVEQSTSDIGYDSAEKIGLDASRTPNSSTSASAIELLRALPIRRC